MLDHLSCSCCWLMRFILSVPSFEFILRVANVLRYCLMAAAATSPSSVLASKMKTERAHTHTHYWHEWRTVRMVSVRTQHASFDTLFTLTAVLMCHSARESATSCMLVARWGEGKGRQQNNKWPNYGYHKHKHKHNKCSRFFVFALSRRRTPLFLFAQSMRSACTNTCKRSSKNNNHRTYIYLHCPSFSLDFSSPLFFFQLPCYVSLETHIVNQWPE